MLCSKLAPRSHTALLSYDSPGILYELCCSLNKNWRIERIQNIDRSFRMSKIRGYAILLDELDEAKSAVKVHPRFDIHYKCGELTLLQTFIVKLFISS